LAAHGGDAISLLVLDNSSAEVLAYVGSPGYFDAEKQGANDGVLARRQPGSALKPFVYAAAMQELGYGPATLLPDLPRDYLVLAEALRRATTTSISASGAAPQALAARSNMPALEVTSRLGPPRLLEMLKRFGFASLDREGRALRRRARARRRRGHATRAHQRVRGAGAGRGATRATAAVVALAPRRRRGGDGSEPARRVLRPNFAALLSDMLSDDAARVAGFGRDSVLNLPFPVAAKTGTSKGYRDTGPSATHAR